MSLQSIMVFILAFIVMGILIGVINSIFDPVRENVGDLGQLTKLDSGTSFAIEPTRSKPVVIDGQTVVIDPLGDKDVRLGVYYGAETPLESQSGEASISFDIPTCRYRDDAGDYQQTSAPSLQAIWFFNIGEDIQPGETVKFEGTLQEEGAGFGTYSCVIDAFYTDSAGTETQIGRGNFILKVED